MSQDGATTVAYTPGGLRTEVKQSPIGADAGLIDRLVLAARRHEAAADVFLGLLMLSMSLYGTRVVQLQYSETMREIARIRPGAEEAAKLGGPIGESGRQTLKIIETVPTNFNPWLGYLLAVVCCVPLMVRRRFPGAAHLIVLPGFMLSVWFVPINIQITSTLVWLTTYFFAAHCRWTPRARWATLALSVIVEVLLVSSVIQNHDTDPSRISARDKIASVILNGLFICSGIALGLLVRRFQGSLATLQSQTDQLRAQQMELERTATLNERVRIAREVHDVVAHHVSVIGMHAGAARMTLANSPSAVSNSLETIEQSSRHAVTDMQRLLTFLRADNTSGAPEITDPQPTLSELSKLFDDHRLAGFELNEEIRVDLLRTSPAVELAVYRIIQESLTNVRKHGRRSDSTIVDVSSDPTQLHIRVHNGLEGNNDPTHMSTYQEFRTGHGLRGMMERVALHGGTFGAGPTTDGGFLVRAVLPIVG